MRACDLIVIVAAVLVIAIVIIALLSQAWLSHVAGQWWSLPVEFVLVSGALWFARQGCKFAVWAWEFVREGR
ncbi:hypothetical protein [Microbulbifer thermotolerans]|uniref:Uncharacterized protein n=1 Tax=Microbulbifer thermotolerans TaxID=252514 RepID=A0AB35HY46_MICTH|nr:hypothetical protein [Microbulbifer thermotolerans]MCX2780406.1 hypothetical protein [Microbulbifer thermotolerans]MCX2802240.1 hypothetical protein [Microbulbifer thermotolerans]MCX2805922.1 hypothetical protein [Microbulbifer thermotolerans]